jgi:mono/diheme cytochrome c family protein
VKSSAAFLFFGFLAGGAPVFANVDAAEGLYVRHCAECHGAAGKGDGPTASVLTKSPTDLTDRELWTALSRDEVTRFVLGGRRLRLELRPGALRKHAAETESIYAFLRSLPSVDWAAVEEGEATYLDRCLPCHDPWGHPQRIRPAGTRLPRDLSEKSFQRTVDDEALARAVRHGRKGMPALVPPISHADARSIVAYVRMLSPGYELYDRYCLSCHGPYGEGAISALDDASAPDFALDADFFAHRSEDEIHAGIWHMLREKNQWMPHFAGILTTEEVRRIVAMLGERALGIEPRRAQP